MYCPLIHRMKSRRAVVCGALLAALVVLSSCGRSPVGSQPAKNSGQAEAKATAGASPRADAPDPRAQGRAPLSARLELDPAAAAPTIDFEGSIRVVLTNNTDRPLRIWNPESRNGYRQFSFHFVDERGNEKIARRRDVQEESYWELLANDNVPGSEVIEIAPQGESSFEFNLDEFVWGERAWEGLPSPNSQQPYRVAVEFACDDRSRPDVWTGTIESQPLAARFVAPRLVTPHHYLWNRFAEKAIEIMEADPKWVTARDEDQCTPLHHAARFGPTAAVQWLLDHGADVNAVAYNEFTPLHLADDPAIVRLILAQQPDLTLQNSSGETAPQRAASKLADARHEEDRQRWREVVSLYADATGGPDLITAATTGDLQRVKAILARSPELADDFQGQSPLRVAASRGHFEICRYLLDSFPVDVDDFERGNGYPIIKEALAHPKIVRLLIEHGADLKTRITWQGFRSGVWIIGDDATTLHYAAADGVPETVTLLIDSGVEIFATARCSAFEDDERQTALEVAAYFGKADSAQAIVNHPRFDAPDAADAAQRQAALDKSLGMGAIPSWLARDPDRPKLVELLIAKGANPQSSFRGASPIQWAARQIHPNSAAENDEIRRTIAVLRQHGAKLDLFSAVAIGDEAEVEQLLKGDPQLADARGPDGYPALHVAIDMDYRKIVALLLQVGGDVNIRNESRFTGGVGSTPLDAAEFWKREELAKLLIEAGGKRQTELDRDP